jgi:hypothetical protein
MKININNYEVFFLDFFDGNLSPEKKKELFSFLAMHPDLQKEFDDYESITLNKDNKAFENNNILRKFDLRHPVSECNFEEYCIAFLEGDLTESQRSMFLVFLESTTEKEIILKTYKKLKLQPEREIVFHDKNQLRKGRSVIPIYWRRISVAASLLLLAGFTYFLIVQNLPVHDSILSVTEEKEISGSDELPEQLLIIEEKQIDLSEIIHGIEVNIEYNKTEEYAIIHEVEVESDKFALENIPFIKPQISRISSGEYVFASIELSTGDYGVQDDADDFVSNLRRNVDELAMAVDTDGVDDSGRISIWDIASLGVNSFGKLTGADVRMEKKRDEEGNVTALAFQSRSLNFTKKIND